MTEALNDATYILGQIRAILVLVSDSTAGTVPPHVTDSLAGASTLAGLLSDKLEALNAEQRPPAGAAP